MSSYLGGFHQVFDVEQSMVDPEDNPVKQSTVQRLGHRVSHCTSLKANIQYHCNISVNTIKKWKAGAPVSMCMHSLKRDASQVLLKVKKRRFLLVICINCTHLIQVVGDLVSYLFPCSFASSVFTAITVFLSISPQTQCATHLFYTLEFGLEYLPS